MVKEKSLMDRLKVYEEILKNEIEVKTETTKSISEDPKLNYLQKAFLQSPTLSELEALNEMKKNLYELFPELKDQS